MKTHTFAGTKYRVSFPPVIGGVTDCRGEATFSIDLVIGNTLDHLDWAVHEALEAMGAPDSLLHNADGTSKTRDIARFLWRLGYRRVQGDK